MDGVQSFKCFHCCELKNVHRVGDSSYLYAKTLYNSVDRVSESWLEKRSNSETLLHYNRIEIELYSFQGQSSKCSLARLTFKFSTFTLVFN